MPTLLSGSLTAAAQLAGPDDVYVNVVPPTAAALLPQPTNVVGVVGSASWGPTNVSQIIGSPGDLATYFGPSTVATYDMPTDVGILLSLGANNIRAVRVSDGTDVAGVLKVNDNTGFASDTLTLAGTWVTGDILTVTITPVSGSPVVVTYTTVAADVNFAGSALSLASAINQSLAVAGGTPFLQLATAAGAIVTLKALVSGTSQNTMGLSATTSSTITITAGGATFSGGAAAGILATLTAKYTGSLVNGALYRMDAGSRSQTTSPTYRLQIFFSASVAAEVYDNIIAYATPGAGFSAATFIANLVAAVNANPQLNALRPASSYFVASAGTSTVVPLTGVVLNISQSQGTSGTDGSTFAGGTTQADAAQIGSSTATPPTGQYAMTGQLGGGVFFLSGNTDLANIQASCIAFAAQQNALFIGAFPRGTATATAVTAIQTYGVASYNALFLKDWVTFTDAVNNVVPRFNTPCAFAAARIVTNPIQISPANQPIGYMTSTERVGPYAVPQQLYSNAELYALEAAGINLITNPCPGGSFFGIRHNKNTLGPADPRGNIAYTRMTQFLIQTFYSTLLGQFVGQGQTPTPGDAVRGSVRALLNGTLAPMQAGGLISNFLVVCDLRNNTASAIQSGFLTALAIVQYLSIIDKFLMTIQGGQTVQIAYAPSTVNANL